MHPIYLFMLEVGLRQTYYRYDLSDPMHLGMKVDPEGNNIEHTVCTPPHPSLALGFWGDDSGQKLGGAYFSMYPG